MLFFYSFFSITSFSLFLLFFSSIPGHWIAGKDQTNFLKNDKCSFVQQNLIYLFTDEICATS